MTGSTPPASRFSAAPPETRLPPALKQLKRQQLQALRVGVAQVRRDLAHISVLTSV